MLSKLADSTKLDEVFEVSIIDRYAQKYGMDPDVVYQKEFDTVFLFIDLWKREGEYGERYRKAEKELTQTT